MWLQRSSSIPEGRQAEHYNYRNRTTWMHRNRKPCNSFFIVNVASGTDCGRVRNKFQWEFFNGSHSQFACFGSTKSTIVYVFIKSILKSLVILAIWLALSSAIYSRIALFFALNRIFFSANENGTVKTKTTQQQIQGHLKKVGVSRFLVVSNEAIQELNSVAVNKHT